MSYYFEDLLSTYKNLWYETKVVPANLDMAYKKSNDRKLIDLKKKMIGLVGSSDPKDEEFIKKHQDMLYDEVKTFVVGTLGLSEMVCDDLFDEGYYDSTKAFINKAKEVSPNITAGDIQQALRNVWVINSLQVYLGAELKMTDSAFAYSMLYPLTDNYLDDPNISKEEKTDFNGRFYKKIKHNIDDYKNDAEKKIFSMIDMIEDDYPRSKYPKVFESLLAILDGQNRSLKQHGVRSFTDMDLLEQTFYKGGTSVLADAYIVKGELTKDEELFSYGYGVLLQISDDLQDLKEDIANNHHTMVNFEARYEKLDYMLDKYLSFCGNYFKYFFKTDNSDRRHLKELIQKSFDLMILKIVYDNRKFFSLRKYLTLRRIGVFSPRAMDKYNKKILYELKIQ